MTVRDAQEGDLARILEIYNEVIATSTAIYRDAPATLDDRLAWWRAKREAGYPTLVADEGGTVLGFATFGDFRPWPATGSLSSTASTCTATIVAAASARR